MHHAAAVLFGLKFADDIHYKFKSSHASDRSQDSELQTYRYKTEFIGLTQNGDSRSFKVMYFGVSGKAVRH